MGVKRHEIFYWDFVTFQVDDTLYKVPKQQFMTGSPFFRDLFLLPQPDGVIEGKDDDHPIHLPGGVTKDEFEILIRAVCSSTLGEGFQQFTKDDWMCCLKLATMWDFKSLRQLAIDHLGTDFPIASNADRVALGLKHQVPAWIHDGISALVKQDQLVFTQDEKELLGFEAALHILEIREEMRGDWERQWRSGETTCPNGHGSSYLTRSTNVGEWNTGLNCSYCSNRVRMDETAKSKSIVRDAIAKRFAEVGILEVSSDDTEKTTGGKKGKKKR